MHSTDDSGLELFCCHASSRLTDYLPHGEGLLCFEWLRSLGENGAGVHAYSPHPALSREYPWLDLYSSKERVRFPSFSYHVFSKESQAVYRKLAPRLKSPWVWRMYPYSENFPSFDTLGAPLAIGPIYSSFLHRPLEGEMHYGLRPHNIASNLGHLGWLRNLKRARLLFTETRQLEEKLQRVYPDKHVVTLPPVIEPPGVQRIPASSDQAVRLVFVANLVPEKRVLDFCRVVHALQSAGLKVEGGVIGDGPDKAAAEQLCASLDPRPRIHFHGQIPNSDVWTEVATYDLFLSMRPEPLGRAIMEAMSIGLVCVCRNELGPLDYIKDGQNGILVGDSDWQAYVARLSELIPRDDLRREIGRNSIATAQAWRRSEVKALLIKAFADALMTT